MAGSTPDVRAALTESLGAPPPASVAALPDDVLARLVEQIEDGRARHEQAGMRALDSALKGVPLPFRAILRKALT